MQTGEGHPCDTQCSTEIGHSSWVEFSLEVNAAQPGWTVHVSIGCSYSQGVTRSEVLAGCRADASPGNQAGIFIPPEGE